MSISRRKGVLFPWKTESPDCWYHTGAFFTQFTSDPRAHPWCGSLVPPTGCGWKLPYAGRHRLCFPRKFLSLARFVLEVTKKSQGVSRCQLPTTCLWSIGCKILNWILCCRLQNVLQNVREAIIQSKESTGQDH